MLSIWTSLKCCLLTIHKYNAPYLKLCLSLRVTPIPNLATQLLGPYLPTFLKNILSLILQTLSYFKAIDSNITPDWLTHTV